MVKRLENVWNGWWVGKTEVERAESREQNSEKMVKRRMRKWVGKRGGERMIQQRGWRRNSEGEMDRERWLCVILWTPFIYTWNKRLGLACKRLSWWGLKWNWHFQFVPWHVCLGLFTHSSASPSLAILLSTPSFSSLSLSPLLIIPSLYLFTNLLPHQSQSDFLSPTSIPQNAHSQTEEIWSRFLYRIYQTCPQKHMCTLYYKYAFCTQDSFQETDASECIKDWSHSLYRK